MTCTKQKLISNSGYLKQDRFGGEARIEFLLIISRKKKSPVGAGDFSSSLHRKSF